MLHKNKENKIFSMVIYLHLVSQLLTPISSLTPMKHHQRSISSCTAPTRPHGVLNTSIYHSNVCAMIDTVVLLKRRPHHRHERAINTTTTTTTTSFNLLFNHFSTHTNSPSHPIHYHHTIYLLYLGHYFRQ